MEASEIADASVYVVAPVTDSELLAAIRTRVSDGIALGGDWHSVFMRYVEAHDDRKFLLLLLDEARSSLRESHDRQ
jgi:hypothetical protein